MKEKYIPGGGCLCHAHSEAECGCDVDWTPREVYELRDKAERYRLDANAMMMQRDRLAEALREIDMARLDDFMGPHDMALKCVLIARESLAAMKGGSDDN
jgi:hypothetical protein